VEEIKEIISRLATHLRAHDFAGHDPYDGLSSRVFNKLPLKNWKLARLVMIHLNKRSPLNLRSILGISEARNPKCIALCASSFLKLSRDDPNGGHYETALQLLSWLLEHQARNSHDASWGYNFDWQSRAFFAPKNSPNAVCTIFAANAFLDAYDISHDRAYLDVARSSCEFLLTDLIVRQKGGLHFRYIPAQDTQIHNVNLLAAALLSRTAAYTGEKRLFEVGEQAVWFSAKRLREDGYWPYGEAANQAWIDHYHTGFNLVALSRYEMYSEDGQFSTAARKAYHFWDSHFFGPNGAPRFYPDRDYPVDIHCIAQAILTYLEYAAVDAGEKIASTLRWALGNMWSPLGYFYFQRHRLYTIRIPYARWGQAWMLYALSSLSNTLAEHG
jgi:hypothetical protein